MSGEPEALAYRPESPPESGVSVEFLYRELRRVGNAVSLLLEGRHLVLHSAPKKPREGQVVWADGVDWRPGNYVSPYEKTFANAFWTKNDCSVVDANATGPYGKTDASTVTFSGTPTNPYLGAIAAASVANMLAGKIVTFSINLKNGTDTADHLLRIRDGADVEFGTAGFTLGAGTCYTGVGYPTITDLGNSWRRCTLTTIVPYNATSGWRVFDDAAGAGANNTYYAHNAQFYEGTPYGGLFQYRNGVWVQL